MAHLSAHPLGEGTCRLRALWISHNNRCIFEALFLCQKWPSDPMQVCKSADKAFLLLLCLVRSFMLWLFLYLTWRINTLVIPEDIGGYWGSDVEREGNQYKVWYGRRRLLCGLSPAGTWYKRRRLRLKPPAPPVIGIPPCYRDNSLPALLACPLSRLRDERALEWRVLGACIAWGPQELRGHAVMLHSGFENLERKFPGALAPIPAVQPTGQAWVFQNRAGLHIHTLVEKPRKCI